jgi:outer membrane protein
MAKKCPLIPALACAALFIPAVAGAAERGDFQLRGRVISISPDDSSGEVRLVDGSGIDGSGVGVDAQITLEVDMTWFLSPNWAVELILATAEHDIDGEGTISDLGKIADAGVLPPTLTLQYHWNTDGKVQPYVGVGLNYTLFYSEDTTTSLDDALMVATDIDLDDSFGWAAQVGLDVQMSDRWYLNFDLKYIDIDTDATIKNRSTGERLADVSVDVNPWVPGIGVGYRW